MIKTLNNNFSTTKLCYELFNKSYLNKNGKIKDELKFKLNFPEFGIVASKIPAKENEKFDTMLFMLEGEGRKEEGGLRTKGCFKFSYEKKDDKWWIVEDKKFIKEIELDETIVKGYEKLPLITIVTVVYNGEKYLEQTIQSVINQTYPNIEYIIIEGGSTDGTLDIIKKYEDKIDYWVSEKDRGIYDAMNKGLTLAKGEYIGLLNADDWYEGNTVKKIVNELNKNKDIDVCYGLLRYIKNEEEYKIDCQNHNFLFERMIPHPTCFIKREIYKKLNGFNMNFKVSADYDFLIRTKMLNAKFHKIDEILSNFRTDGVSSVSTVGAIESLKIKRKYRLINFKQFLLKMIFFKFKNFINF